MDFLTPDEAREISLPLRPLKRYKRLQELAGGIAIRQDGWSPLPLVMTRGDLIRIAEAHQTAANTMIALEEMNSRTRLEGGEIYGEDF